MSVTIELPWPPTVNTYWRRAGNRIHISKRGHDYRRAVLASVLAVPGIATVSSRSAGMYPTPLRGRLKVSFEACPPDRRRRDIDNLLKSSIDALTHAGLWVDDEQIDDLRIIRGEIEKDGRLLVHIEELSRVREG